MSSSATSARSDVTVLLSSHILAEVQQVCDSATIIGSGRLLSSGAVEDLVGSESAAGVRVGVQEVEPRRRVLSEAGLRVTPDDGRLYVEGVTDPAHVTKLLAEHGIYVRRADRGPAGSGDGLPQADRGRCAMRQLLVELTRLLTRRSVAVVLLAAVVLAALLVGSAAYATRPPDQTEKAAAEQMLSRQSQLNDAEYRRCRKDPEDYYGNLAGTSDCEELRPSLQWYLPRPVLSIGDEVRDRGRLLLVLLAGVGILVGATFVGADWASGSLSNQLLFEPRRLRLWLAKAVAVVVGVTAFAAVVLLGFWGALAAVSAARDVSVADETWRVVAGTAGRGLTLVAATGLGGFALTVALRHTVGTLGLLFGYAVVGEGLAASLPFAKMSQWSISNNLLAVVHDGVQVYDRSLCADTTGSCSSTYVLPLWHGAAYLGALLVVAVVVSVVTFRRRDIA